MVADWCSRWCSDHVFRYIAATQGTAFTARRLFDQLDVGAGGDAGEGVGVRGAADGVVSRAEWVRFGPRVLAMFRNASPPDDAS